MTGDERLAKVAEVLAEHRVEQFGGVGRHACTNYDCDYETWDWTAIEEHQAEVLADLLDEFRAEDEARALGIAPCSRCGVNDVLNARPHEDIVACERCAFHEGEARIQRALLAARVVCPVHGIPDCGPLLNGCQIPRYIAEWRGEFLADLRAALAAAEPDAGER